MRVCLVTSRLGTGIPLTFLYSVWVYTTRWDACRESEGSVCISLSSPDTISEHSHQPINLCRQCSTYPPVSIKACGMHTVGHCCSLTIQVERNLQYVLPRLSLLNTLKTLLSSFFICSLPLTHCCAYTLVDGGLGGRGGVLDWLLNSDGENGNGNIFFSRWRQN